jgi:hypothetical protein
LANRRWSRVELLTKVRQGKLTPKKAELEAARLGLSPFEVVPKPSDFHPMTEETWSLPMALAWIMWRSPDVVLEMWDFYREKFQLWELHCWRKQDGRRITEGHILKRKLPARLSYLNPPYDRNLPSNKVIANHREAFRLLSLEAERGKWRASGHPTDGGPRREISPFEWADLLDLDVPAPPLGYLSPRVPSSFSSGHALPVVRDKKRGALQFGYDDVRFPVVGLLASFPAVGADAERASTEPLRRRGDFLKIKSAVDALYPSGIPEALSNPDIARRITDYLRRASAKVPHDKTVTKYLKELR